MKTGGRYPAQGEQVKAAQGGGLMYLHLLACVRYSALAHRVLPKTCNEVTVAHGLGSQGQGVVLGKQQRSGNLE
jgi:hypothetical protein